MGPFASPNGGAGWAHAEDEDAGAHPGQKAF